MKEQVFQVLKARERQMVGSGGWEEMIQGNWRGKQGGGRERERKYFISFETVSV